MKSVYVVFIALAVAMGLSSPAWSQSPEKKGRQIADKSDQQASGWRDYTAKGSMVLSGGGQGTRKFEFKAREAGGGSRSLLVFDWPGDIRDTGLLTHNKASGGDSQWVFLPADRRVRRISSSGRSGSFVGSEFAYEDMTDQAVGKFSYRWVADKGCCHIVERVPKYSSGYSKQVVHFSKSNFLVQRVEYFNRRGAHSKTMTVSNYRRGGSGYRPGRMRMVNHITGKSTTLSWSGFRFGVGLGNNDFSTRALERGR